MNGKLLNEILNIQAEHSLYREDGTWYHHLTGFPGALFDKNGYIIFESQLDYLNHVSLQHGQDLHIANGIASIEGYVAFSDEDKRKIVLSDKKNIDEESVRRIRKIGLIIRNINLVRNLKNIYENSCQLCGMKLEISKNLYYSEVHHIKPLGQPYNGPDIQENMICVCPNCHVLLDFGGIKLDVKAFKCMRHSINHEYITYHNTSIFKFN